MPGMAWHGLADEARTGMTLPVWAGLGATRHGLARQTRHGISRGTLLRGAPFFFENSSSMWRIFGLTLAPMFTTLHIPPPTPPEVSREEMAHARVVALKRELDLLNGEMLRFKTANKIRTDKFSRLLGVESPSIGGREVLRREWQTLLNRRDALVSAWHQSLHEWAQAKELKK
jgi:hypothetical protein